MSATTNYFAAIAIPGREERMVVGPVDSISEVPMAVWRGCEVLVEDGQLDSGAAMPPWRSYAEEDGVERPLTGTEKAALTANLEQVFGGMSVRFRPQGEED